MSNVALAPVADRDRFGSIDMLRGCALLGILLMNIGLFALPSSAYFNPRALGEPSPGEFAVWSIVHVLADLKFMTMFSLLFGAGVVLMNAKATPGSTPHYRRMFWLLVFGLIHAYLIWHGDILVLYAICGLFIYPARRLTAARLFAVGTAVLACGSLLSLGAGVALRAFTPDQLRLLSEDFWSPTAADIAKEVAAFRGGWLAQQSFRAAYSWEFHTFDIWQWGIWRAAGLMLIGMALLKVGVLTGSRGRTFHLRMAAAGFLVGLPLVIIGVFHSQATGWNVVDSYFIASQWNYWGSIGVSLGWIGTILLWWQSCWWPGLIRRIKAIGQSALSCYIAQSLIGTTIFYGHGLGLFGSLSRAELLLVVGPIWLALLLAAPWWLERFRFGPLEWLWRTLSYQQRQPFRRAVPQKFDKEAVCDAQ